MILVNTLYRSNTFATIPREIQYTLSIMEMKDYRKYISKVFEDNFSKSTVSQDYALHLLLCTSKNSDRQSITMRKGGR